MRSQLVFVGDRYRGLEIFHYEPQVNWNRVAIALDLRCRDVFSRTITVSNGATFVRWLCGGIA